MNLPYAPDAHGYGQSAAEVGRFTVDGPQVLDDYHAAVHAATLDVVGGMSPEQLAAVVDESWDPPVTAVVRLVSVLDDAAQHCGQAAYVRGLLP
ncbi:mycothiol transferase [Calidifontibacter terrae]